MLCPNPRCLHRRRYGEPAELPEGTDACPACGSQLAPDPSSPSGGAGLVRLVTIAEFGEPSAAHLAKGRLEAEGLAAHVAGEHLASLNAMFADTGGLIRLEVAPQDAARAIAILDRDHSEVVEVEPAANVEPQPLVPICPRCGSASVDREGRKPSSLIGILLAALRGAHLRCFTCGHRWHGATEAD